MATSLPKTTNPSTPATENRERLERLCAFSPDQLNDGMRWLAGYAPEVFDAVLDAVEPFTFDGPAEPDPVCGICGADIGIFVKFGLDWRHYRGDALGESEIFDAGHAPQLTWRQPG